MATAALPDTILKWYRRLVARKFDGSSARRAPGRPPIGEEIEELIVRMAWAECIQAHLAVLVGTDFFTVEVLTLRGLVTYYVLFFIHLQGELIVPGI